MTFTGGNIIVENIRPGDIHYEYAGNIYVKSIVFTRPRMKIGAWEWKSYKIDTDGNITDSVITYIVHPKYQAYAPKLYDHEAYKGCTQM